MHIYMPSSVRRLNFPPNFSCPPCPQVVEYNGLRERAAKKTAPLVQKLERMKHERRTDDDALEQARLKEQELTGRRQQLQDQRWG